MEEIHHFTSDQKLHWWGYGEWIEEPDEIAFEHEGLKCQVIRSIDCGPFNFFVFGGYFCGFIHVSKDHPWTKKDCYEIEIAVHGGITYSREFADLWVFGFDCAHSTDLIPYERKIKSTIVEGLKEQYKHILPSAEIFENSYKNVSFAIEETKKLAECAKAALMEKNAMD